MKVRLARVLADFGRQHGHHTHRGLEIDVKLTQPELAGCIGSKRAAAEAAFRELRKEGLVVTAHGRITVLRPADLDQTAGYVDIPGSTQIPYF